MGLERVTDRPDQIYDQEGLAAAQFIIIKGNSSKAMARLTWEDAIQSANAGVLLQDSKNFRC